MVFRLHIIASLCLVVSTSGSYVRRNTEAFAYASNARNDSSFANHTMASVQYHRTLLEKHNFFTPLTCNLKPCSAKKSNWTLEAYTSQTEMVVIPCGHCILLDFQFDEATLVAPWNVTLHLPFGIDIQGWLHIPGNAHKAIRLTIITPFVRVQGKLTMRAKGSVGSLPYVRFLFVDSPNVDSAFVPAGNNMYACSALKSGFPTPCEVGPKSLVVAGGQLDVRGLASDCATWVHLHDVVDRSNGRSDILVRDKGIRGCWGRGAEILITSHTTDFESAQVFRLIADPKPHTAGLICLQLNDTVVPSVTVRHNDTFAVEVALLSRNFVFQGADDETDRLLGGHLMVMHTPTVLQLIQGIEFLNFGRQGETGRYPVHFHLCDSVTGSVVAKNSIRHSNQRCIVAHGTHNLTISNNVAHETKGHCYMLEDGGERDNTFYRNLGASTRAAIRLVRPFETDGSDPSTFWCSNPTNTWTQNVAAGSESTGFWFELQREVRPPTSLMNSSIGLGSPRRLPLKLFVNNVAHSNVEHGLRTYPLGFKPPVQAVFDNTRSYKNKRSGAFFHESYDLKLSGGVLADNSIQADLDRADSIVIDGTKVLGSTARFNEIVQTQAQRFGHSSSIVGVQLHSFVFNETKLGASLFNVTFSGFANATSSRVTLIDIDADKLSGHFDYWTTFQGIKVIDSIGSASFDFRQAAAVGVTDIVLIDVDSSFKPSGSSAVGISSIISSSPLLTTFIDVEENCHDFSSQGYFYCRSTCFRTVTYATNPSGTDNLVLRVTDKMEPSKTTDFPGFYNLETEVTDGQMPEQRNTWILKHRHFAPSLPNGMYTAQFIDTSNGQISWPTFVATTIERNVCSDSAYVNPIQIFVPEPDQSKCRELVRNGRMESSSSSYPYWLQAETRIELVPGGGLDDSNAISDTDHSVFHAYIGQFIDTRCLTLGRKYDVSAWVKLVNPVSKSPVDCDKTGGSCPSVVLRYRDQEDPTGQSFKEEAITVAFNVVATKNGWSLLRNTVTIDARLADASSVAIVVRRGMIDVKMYLDDVAMILVT